MWTVDVPYSLVRVIVCACIWESITPMTLWTKPNVQDEPSTHLVFWINNYFETSPVFACNSCWTYMVPTWKLHLNPNKSSKITTNPSTPKVNVKGTREMTTWWSHGILSFWISLWNVWNLWVQLVAPFKFLRIKVRYVSRTAQSHVIITILILGLRYLCIRWCQIHRVTKPTWH